MELWRFVVNGPCTPVLCPSIVFPTPEFARGVRVLLFPQEFLVNRTRAEPLIGISSISSSAALAGVGLEGLYRADTPAYTPSSSQWLPNFLLLPLPLLSVPKCSRLSGFGFFVCRLLPPARLLAVASRCTSNFGAEPQWELPAGASYPASFSLTYWVLNFSIIPYVNATNFSFLAPSIDFKKHCPHFKQAYVILHSFILDRSPPSRRLSFLASSGKGKCYFSEWHFSFKVKTQIYCQT